MSFARVGVELSARNLNASRIERPLSHSSAWMAFQEQLGGGDSRAGDRDRAGGAATSSGSIAVFERFGGEGGSLVDTGRAWERVRSVPSVAREAVRRVGSPGATVVRAAETSASRSSDSGGEAWVSIGDEYRGKRGLGRR